MTAKKTPDETKNIKIYYFSGNPLYCRSFAYSIYFFKNSYKYSEEQFRESATVALKEVAWQIMLETGNAANYDSITPVEIISNNTYIVNVDALFDKEMVKRHLIEELQKHEIYAAFEFAIFNPETRTNG